MSLLKKILFYGSDIIEAKKSYTAYKSEYENFIRMPRTKLTKEDKESIRSLWSDVIPAVSLGYMYFEVYKRRTEDVLDARFIPP